MLSELSSHARDYNLADASRYWIDQDPAKLMRPQAAPLYMMEADTPPEWPDAYNYVHDNDQLLERPHGDTAAILGYDAIQHS